MNAQTARARRSSVAAIAIFVATAVTSIACRHGSSGGDGAAPSASASSSSVAAVAGGIPVASALILSTNNADGLPVYAGRAGAVEGFVKAIGLPPLDATNPPPPPSDKCAESRAMYMKAFRVGPDGALADAIVGATGYEAYVPPKGDAKTVHIKGCAFDTRTLALTFGQRLEVRNHDREAYLPHLNGARNPALMVAMPNGDAVRIYPREPGRYLLTDDIKHPWMATDVFVFKYATHDVTGADGRYRIEGIPEGRVKISVWHPRIGQTIEKVVEVRGGETVKGVDFEVPNEAPKAAPSGSNKVPTDLR